MLKLFEHETLDVQNLSEEETAIRVEKLNLQFGQKHVLHNISMRIPKNRITSLIGQSGCGKSTLISCFNRMNWPRIAVTTAVFSLVAAILTAAKKMCRSCVPR